LHGSVFVALKTEGPVRDDALRFAAGLSLPVLAVVTGFGLWTQLVHGQDWTWIVWGASVMSLLAAITRVSSGAGEGWAFAYTTTAVAALVILLFVRCTRMSCPPR
jgi:cytochrome d ubiquinol oxidase subunit II